LLKNTHSDVFDPGPPLKNPGMSIRRFMGCPLPSWKGRWNLFACFWKHEMITVERYSIKNLTNACIIVVLKLVS